MGSFDRKVIRNRLKKIMGSNNINNAWHKYQEIQKAKKKKKETDKEVS